MRIVHICLLFVGADAAKILVYNMKFAHLHSNFLGNVADILVDAGHDVTSLIPGFATELKDGTVKSKIVRVPPNPEAEANHKKVSSGEVDMFSFSELNPITPFIMGFNFGFAFAKQCETTLDSGVVEQLQAMLSHLLKPRAVIKLSTSVLLADQHEQLGVPRPLSYNPAQLSAKEINIISGSLTRSLDVHSFVSRAWNIYAECLSRIMFAPTHSRVEAIFKRRFGDSYPTLREITSNVAYVFTNSEPLIDFATPTLSRVIEIGGLGAKPPKELDEYWSSVMNRRSKVVLISFGSFAQSYLLDQEVKDGFLKIASAFPSVTFIWKYEKKDTFALEQAAQIDNLVLTEWMPQNDLLAHPNLVVFITHGGMGSVQELTMRGKPALLIPIFFDQPRNSAMIEHNKLGKVLSKLEVGNHVKIVALLKELMENHEYAENSKRVAKMLSNKPFSSKEKLLKYVEFAAEFGPSPALRPQSQDMSFIEYHNLDIVLAGIAVVVLINYAFVKTSVRLLRRITSRKAKSE